MQLKDFATLAEAQAYEQVTYRKIGGNEASQILSVMGALDNVESNQNNTTAVEVITGVPTTVEDREHAGITAVSFQFLNDNLIRPREILKRLEVFGYST